MRNGRASKMARGLTSTVAALVLALGAVACSDDDDASTNVPPVTAGGPTTSEATTSADDSTTTGPPMGSDTDSTEAPGTTTAAGGLASGQCQRLAESPDGIYPVGDAGEVELVVEGSTVRLVEARPAEGWTATGDLEDDDDEVEVDFRRDGREVEFEAEMDDGRLEIDVCDR